MTPASQVRLAVARELAEKFASYETVEVACVGGSVGRGVADGHSDIDFGVFWSVPPTDDERRDAVHAMSNLDGRFVRFLPFDASESGWADDFYVGQNEAGERASGLCVEISHYTRDFLDSVIRDVTQGFDPDPVKQGLLTGILDSIALVGESRIEEWRSRIRDYPDGLARAVIDRYAQIDYFSNWKKSLRRGENLFVLHAQFCELQEKLLRICLALSRRYFCGFKWIYQNAELMTVAPESFIPRLRSVFSLGPAEGAEVLRRLVHETYDLIEAQFPEARVDWWRSVFDFERSFWDESPLPIR